MNVFRRLEDPSRVPFTSLIFEKPEADFPCLTDWKDSTEKMVGHTSITTVVLIICHCAEVKLSVGVESTSVLFSSVRSLVFGVTCVHIATVAEIAPTSPQAGMS